jgi:flagellar basal-body rod protein FlgB
VKLFEATKIPVLHRALDTYALRQKVISGNIANIATAGYRAKTVEFEDHLATALRAGVGTGGGVTHEGHIPLSADSLSGVRPLVTDSHPDARPGEDERSNGVNNVDLDNEMAELAKNQIRFKFSTRLITDTFRGIQRSIRGTV